MVVPLQRKWEDFLTKICGNSQFRKKPWGSVRCDSFTSENVIYSTRCFLLFLRISACLWILGFIFLSLICKIHLNCIIIALLRWAYLHLEISRCKPKFIALAPKAATLSDLHVLINSTYSLWLTHNETSETSRLFPLLFDKLKKSSVIFQNAFYFHILLLLSSCHHGSVIQLVTTKLWLFDEQGDFTIIIHQVIQKGRIGVVSFPDEESSPWRDFRLK